MCVLPGWPTHCHHRAGKLHRYDDSHMMHSRWSIMQFGLLHGLPAKLSSYNALFFQSTGLPLVGMSAHTFYKTCFVHIRVHLSLHSQSQYRSTCVAHSRKRAIPTPCSTWGDVVYVYSDFTVHFEIVMASFSPGNTAYAAHC